MLLQRHDMFLCVINALVFLLEFFVSGGFQVQCDSRMGVCSDDQHALV